MKKIFIILCIFIFNAINANANTLFEFAKKGTSEQLWTYISRNRCSKEELTRALHMAVDKNPSADVITLLAKAGADVNIHLLDAEVYGGVPEEDLPDCEAGGSSPLSRAWGNIPKMEALLQAGADPNEGAFEGGTLFTQEASHVETPSDVMRLLIKYKADPNAPVEGPNCPRYGDAAIEGVPCTALELAIKNPETVRLLLDAGARTNRHIYKLALKAGLPQSLLQRLDHTRLPDGSQKTAKKLFASAIEQIKNESFGDCKTTLDDIHHSFELPKQMLSSLYYLKSICYGHNIEFAKKAIEIDSGQPRNHLQYMASLAHRHDYKKLLFAANQASRVLQNDARLYLYRGIGHMHLGNINQAETDIDKSLAIREMPQSCFAKGELHLLMGDSHNAERYFVKSLEMGQKIHADLNLLYQSAMKEREGDMDGAVKLAKKAEEIQKINNTRAGAGWHTATVGSDILVPDGLIDPERRDFFFARLSILNTAQKGWKEKNSQTDLRKMEIDSLKRAINRHDVPPHKSAPFYYLLTFCLEDSAKRLESIDKAIELNPKEYVYYYRRGELHFRNGRYDLAQKNFSQALEHGQQNRAHQNLLYQASMAARNGFTQKALLLAEKARGFAGTAYDGQAVESAIAALSSGGLPDIALSDNWAAFGQTASHGTVQRAEVPEQPASHPSASQPAPQHSGDRQTDVPPLNKNLAPRKHDAAKDALNKETLDTFL